MNSAKRMSLCSLSDLQLTWALSILLLILTLIFMANALFPPVGQVLGGSDIRGQFLPWLIITRQAIREWRLPLWDPCQYSGYPFLSNPQVWFFYPPAWPAFFWPNIGISWYVVVHLWLAGVGMLLFVRRLRGSWVGATLAALTFTFSGFTAARLEAGHVRILATAAWLPWILLAYAWTMERGDLWSALVSGLPFGLAILSGNMTLLFYACLIWLAFAVYLGLTGQRWLLLARQLAVGVATGFMLGAIQALPQMQAMILSMRAKGTLAEFGSRWSLPPFHLVAFFIPGYFGIPGYTGWWSVDNFEELTYYVGALPLLAIPLGLRKPTRLTWLYTGLIVFGLLLALGTYGFLYPVIYAVIPIFRVWRAPARAAFLCVFAASALLGETVSHWTHTMIEDRETALRFFSRWILPTVALFGVLGLAATGARFAPLHPSEAGGRLWHQANGWAWALAVFTVGGMLLWLYLAQHPDHSRQQRVLAIALGGLIVMDLWSFGFRLVRLQPATPAPLWTDTKQVIGETLQRVIPWAVNLHVQNDAALVGVRSVLGYGPLESTAYQDFAMSVPDPRSTAYDILAVEYVLAQGPLEEAFLQGERGLRLIASTGSAWLYRRPSALPMARLVYQTEVIGDRGNAIARVHQADFDPATTAILSQAPPCQIGPTQGANGGAEIVEERPGYWRIEVESEAPSLLVLAETAYPGWRAMVDGKQATPLTAYTVVRAVCVPAGRHQVEWIFDPMIYKAGAAMTLGALFLVSLAGIVVWRLRRPVFDSRKLDATE